MYTTAEKKNAKEILDLAQFQEGCDAIPYHRSLHDTKYNSLEFQRRRVFGGVPLPFLRCFFFRVFSVLYFVTHSRQRRMSMLLSHGRLAFKCCCCVFEDG